MTFTKPFLLLTTTTAATTILFSFAPSAAQAATCQLCPANSTMMGASNPIPSSLFSTPIPVATCGEIDSLLSRLPFGSVCTSALSPFLTVFDAEYYCECSNVSSPGICQMCSSVTNVNGVVSSGPLVNFTCPQANLFFEALATSTACTPGGLTSLCCPSESGGSGNSTTGGGGGGGLNGTIVTTPPSLTTMVPGGSPSNTMMPTPTPGMPPGGNNASSPTTMAPSMASGGSGGGSVPTPQAPTTPSTSQTSGATTKVRNMMVAGGTSWLVVVVVATAML